MKGHSMSHFMALTVVFNKGGAYEGHTHTLEFRDDHNEYSYPNSDVVDNAKGVTGGVSNAMQALIKAGYEIVSVIVTDNVGDTETLGDSSTPDVQSLTEFLSEAKSSYSFIDAMTAFVLYYGWSEYQEGVMDDNYSGEYDSEEAFARDFTSDRLSEMNTELPEWLEVDWEETARNLSSDFSYQRHNGSTFIFTL